MEEHVPKRKAKIYLAYAAGIFDGRDEKIRCRRQKLLRTRSPHDCLSPLTMELHRIPANTLAFCESAIVDGVFGRYYVCIKCLDDYFDNENLANEAEDLR